MSARSTVLVNVYNLPPIFTGPANITYECNSTSHSISWTFTDASYGTTSFVGPFGFNDLNVAGNTDLQGPVTLSNVTINGTADLKGPFSLCNIVVSDASSLNTLTASGPTTLSNNVNVHGAAIFHSNLRVLGSLEATKINYAYSNVTVYTSEQINSNLTVLGSTSLEGPIALSNALTAHGAVTFNSNLTASNIATSNLLAINMATSNLTVYDGMTASNIATSNLGAINLGASNVATSNLTVAGTTALNSNLTVLGSTSLHGLNVASGNVSLSSGQSVVTHAGDLNLKAEHRLTIQSDWNSNNQDAYTEFQAGSNTNVLRVTPTGITMGGASRVFAHASDTVTTPTYTWTGDATTGIYHQAAGSIGVSTSGVNRLTISSTGLDVVGQVLASCNITTPFITTPTLFTRNISNSNGSAIHFQTDLAAYISAVAPNIASSSDNHALPGTSLNARPLTLYGSNITYD
jgi:predicted outer membrane repeat protein